MHRFGHEAEAVANKGLPHNAVARNGVGQKVPLPGPRRWAAPPKCYTRWLGNTEPQFRYGRAAQGTDMPREATSLAQLQPYPLHHQRPARAAWVPRGGVHPDCSGTWPMPCQRCLSEAISGRADKDARLVGGQHAQSCFPRSYLRAPACPHLAGPAVRPQPRIASHRPLRPQELGWLYPCDVNQCPSSAPCYLHLSGSLDLR